jgi:hypothetical protein
LNGDSCKQFLCCPNRFYHKEVRVDRRGMTHFNKSFLRAFFLYLEPSKPRIKLKKTASLLDEDTKGDRWDSLYFLWVLTAAQFAWLP